MVEGFELRKSAILHKAFTGELTERWRKEHGVGLDSWAGFSHKYESSGIVSSIYLKYSSLNTPDVVAESVILLPPINLPTFDEQIEIVRILESLFAKMQQAKEAAEAVLAQIDTMKKAILARAFRGELGTNDPNYLADKVHDQYCIPQWCILMHLFLSEILFR